MLNNDQRKEITVYYFDGERLTGHWQITDRLGVYQQLRS